MLRRARRYSTHGRASPTGGTFDSPAEPRECAPACCTGGETRNTLLRARSFLGLRRQVANWASQISGRDLLRQRASLVLSPPAKSPRGDILWRTSTQSRAPADRSPWVSWTCSRRRTPRRWSGSGSPSSARRCAAWTGKSGVSPPRVPKCLNLTRDGTLPPSRAS